MTGPCFQLLQERVRKPSVPDLPNSAAEPFRRHVQTIGQNSPLRIPDSGNRIPELNSGMFFRRIMPSQRTTRKNRFKAALALAGKTAEQFARDNNVSPTQLHYIVAGERESAEVNAAIDALIEKHLETQPTSAA